MLEGSKRLDDAFLVWKRVAKLRPEDGDVQMKLAYYYLNQKDDAGARPHLEKAAALNPDDGPAHYQLAELLTRTGEYDRAWDELLEAEALGVNTQYLRSRLEAIRAGQPDPYALSESPTDPPREEEEQP
jgi:Flp pilus assembly protein TadD